MLLHPERRHQFRVFQPPQQLLEEREALPAERVRNNLLSLFHKQDEQEIAGFLELFERFLLGASEADSQCSAFMCRV